MSLRVVGALVITIALIGGNVTIAGVAMPAFSPHQLMLLGAAGVGMLMLGLITERPRSKPPSGVAGRRGMYISVQLEWGHKPTQERGHGEHDGRRSRSRS
jgi:hypothetical protein